MPQNGRGCGVSTWGCPQTQRRDPWVVLPETHGQTSCWSSEAVCRNCAPFMPLIFLPASFTSSSLPSVMEVPPLDCWCCCRETSVSRCDPNSWDGPLLPTPPWGRLSPAASTRYVPVSFLSFYYTVTNTLPHLLIQKNYHSKGENYFFFFFAWRLELNTHHSRFSFMNLGKNSLKEKLGWGALPWWLSGKESARPMHETWIGSLVWEDPMCQGATKPMRPKYWADVLEPGSHSYWSPHALQSLLHNKRSPCKLKPVHLN